MGQFDVSRSKWPVLAAGTNVNGSMLPLVVHIPIPDRPIVTCNCFTSHFFVYAYKMATGPPVRQRPLPREFCPDSAQVLTQGASVRLLSNGQKPRGPVWPPSCCFLHSRAADVQNRPPASPGWRLQTRAVGHDLGGNCPF